MPAYHSKQTLEDVPEACSCALCPIRTDLKGPAVNPPAGVEDIIDETLTHFRANVLFRNFDVKGGADRTLIYLTIYAVQCLVKCENIPDKFSALREMNILATKQFLCPGDVGWPLGGLFPSSRSKIEGDNFRSYFRQARGELGIRLMNLLFDADGTKNKWWQAFSKRRFMGKELKD